MSKAKDEYVDSLKSNICHNYQTYILKDKAHQYICELEQRVSHLIDSNVARDLVIKENDKAIIELVSSLSISLDDKRRKLYLSELKETLNKHSEYLTK